MNQCSSFRLAFVKRPLVWSGLAAAALVTSCVVSDGPLPEPNHGPGASDDVSVTADVAWPDTIVVDIPWLDIPILDTTLPPNCPPPTQQLRATGTNQSALTVDGGGRTLQAVSIVSDSQTSSQGDSSQIGTNAALLIRQGANVTLSCSTIDTTGAGATGVFATGSSTIHLQDVRIQCEGEGSRGVVATGGSTANLEKVNLVTTGNGGRGISVERDGSAVSVNNSLVRTSGNDAPAVFSAGTAMITGGTIAAAVSEAVMIDGGHMVNLADTTLSAGPGDRLQAVTLFHSGTGDPQAVQAMFTMDRGSLTWSAPSGRMVHVTNVTAVFNLKDVVVNSSAPVFLNAAADQWGTTGGNGGHVIFSADGTALRGDMLADAWSTLNLTFMNRSAYQGAVNPTGAARTVYLTLDANSCWEVTDDSVVTTITNADPTFANVIGNGHRVCYHEVANSSLTATWSLSGGGMIEPCP